MASSTLTAVPHGAHTIHTHGKAAKAVSEDSPAVSDPITVSPKVQMSFAEAPTVHWRTREVGGRARRIVSATRSESHKRMRVVWGRSMVVSPSSAKPRERRVQLRWQDTRAASTPGQVRPRLVRERTRHASAGVAFCLQADKQSGPSDIRPDAL